jgi:hypothetical protein
VECRERQDGVPGKKKKKLREKKQSREKMKMERKNE